MTESPADRVRALDCARARATGDHDTRDRIMAEIIRETLGIDPGLYPATPAADQRSGDPE